MTMASDLSAAPTTHRSGAVSTLLDLLATIASLALRFALAIPFYRSGLTKWNGFLELSPGATYLFENEFKLNILGNQYPFPFPDIAAWGAGIAEIVFPVLLVFGLATRFAALGLLGMAGVIFLVYPNTWADEQLPWAAMALALMAFGAGKISLDYLISRKFKR
jgi:putative oxidoreductase